MAVAYICITELKSYFVSDAEFVSPEWVRAARCFIFQQTDNATRVPPELHCVGQV